MFELIYCFFFFNDPLGEALDTEFPPSVSTCWSNFDFMGLFHDLHVRQFFLLSDYISHKVVTTTTTTTITTPAAAAVCVLYLPLICDPRSKYGLQRPRLHHTRNCSFVCSRYTKIHEITRFVFYISPVHATGTAGTVGEVFGFCWALPEL